MKELSLKVRKNGFDYTQVIHCGNYYIYEQDYSSGTEYGPYDIPKEIKYYEIFRVKVKSAEKIKGKYYPEREVFPGNEDFGYTAWTYPTLEKALYKLMKLKGHKK